LAAGGELPTGKLIPSKNSHKRGAALIVVLAMVALLTPLIVAFFAHSLKQQRISANHASFARVDLLARGAVSVIQADLKQEIAALSSGTGIVSGGTTTTLYWPGANSRFGAYHSADGVAPSRESLRDLTVSVTELPNLVAMSSASHPLWPGGEVRAAPALTSAASLNGRSVTPAAWNKPLLLPKADETSPDLTPQNLDERRAPAWILVSRAGDNPSGWSEGLRVVGGGAEVLGRYAFMIYNEGGLLDANVAGGPAVSVSGSQRALWSRKGSAVFADLTQIGLQQKDINQLAGWRNYATAAPGGQFPDYIFDSGATERFFNHAIGQTTRFMTVSGTLRGGHSDRMFSSRQQLIKFFTGATVADGDKTRLQNALQYLGTFSRSLNRPSYWPHPDRPVVQGPQAIGDSSAGDYLGGGNSAYRNDNLYNPPFPTQRMTAGGVRNDGSKFAPGEPLVGRRFALSRLLWLTYKGPSSGVSANDELFREYVRAGMPEAEVERLRQAGTPDNIRKYFGLEWVPDATAGYAGYWKYDHGITERVTVTVNYRPATKTLTVIGTPDKVLAANREPDFFELLKMAVTVGSMAKARVKMSQDDNDMGMTLRDSTVDFQIFQLGVNIMDGANPTQYPACVKLDYADGGNYLRAFYGATDLPGLYGVTKAVFVSELADPPPPADAAPVAVSGTLKPGKVALLAVPSVWNPYAAGGAAPAIRPARLRVSIASTGLFENNPAPQPVTIGVHHANFPATKVKTQAKQQVFWSRANTGLVFANSSVLYREPTVLCRPGFPSGSGLRLDAGNLMLEEAADGYPEAGSPHRFIGFKIGRYDQRWPDGGKIYTVNHMSDFSCGADGVVVRLEYETPSGWAPYQESFFRIQTGYFQVPLNPDGTENAPTFLRPRGSSLWDRMGYSAAPNLSTKVENSIITYVGHYFCDPRASRFGAPKTWPAPGFFGDEDDMTVYSRRPDGRRDVSVCATSGVGGLDRSENNQGWRYQTGKYFAGGVSQNLQGPGKNPAYNSPTQTHYADPDGVTRRAMGGWVNQPEPSSASGLPMATPSAADSRPILPHRPYRTVAELGAVFRGTPWKNLDFSFPESGDSALLDVFCVSDDRRPDALEAGRVDLNTRQPRVLAALLAGAYRDEFTADRESQNLTASEAERVADRLVARTTARRPLLNLADLVGYYDPSVTVSGSKNNFEKYDGFTADLGLDTYSGGAASPSNLIQRFREASIRALADAGQVGTWNLLIDVIAQTGRYPAAANGLDDFMVEGECRYWVHVAIDRLTGQIIDRQIERVN
jgi:hypothetical protein